MANQTTVPVVKETAGIFALNLRDFALGAIVAVASAVVTLIIDTIKAGGFEAIDWKMVGQIALSAFIGYLSKNFLTEKKTIVMAPKEEVKIMDTTTGQTLAPNTKPV